MSRFVIITPEDYAAMCERYGRSMSANTKLLLQAWTEDAAVRAAVDTAIARLAAPKLNISGR